MRLVFYILFLSYYSLLQCNSTEVTNFYKVLSGLLYANQIWSLDLFLDSTETQIKNRGGLFLH